MITGYKIINEDFGNLFIPRVLFSDAGLWLWGRNNYGQLGDNSITNRSSPVQTVAAGTNWKLISSGGYQIKAGIKTDGTLWNWGDNASGQLGDNSRTNRSSPVQTVSGGTNWKYVACGALYTAAIKTDGTLWLWGRNNYGQLGVSTATSAVSSPVILFSYNDWKFVTAGANHLAAIKTDGTLWTWGYAGNGQLGNNAVTNRSSPVQTVSGGNNWKSVAAGAFYTVGIKTDGTLWLWGSNSYGQLGDNSRTSRSSPVQTTTGGTNWKFVECGYGHTMGIKTDGRLWTWGFNAYGALGDNTTADKSSPVQTVSGGTNWKSTAGGQYNTGCIKADGTLWTWGWNVYGQLGDNTAADKSSPVQTVAAGTNWRLVGGGHHTMMATKDDNF